MSRLSSRGESFLAFADDMEQNPDCCSVRAGIAIVLFGYGLGNSPSLINMAETLSKSGYSVDFFTCHTYLGNVSFSDPCIRIHDIVRIGLFAYMYN